MIGTVVAIVVGTVGAGIVVLVAGTAVGIAVEIVVEVVLPEIVGPDLGTAVVVVEPVGTY